MSEHPPYMNAYGSISKVLNKIIEARRPDRFTQDYLETVLNLPSSSMRPIISILKRIGFLNPDGTPTELYSKFKTEHARKSSMAVAIRIGYPELFKRNEYVYKLDKGKLTDLLVEMTGLERDHQIIRNVVGTFSALNSFADFEQEETTRRRNEDDEPHISEIASQATQLLPKPNSEPGVGMNLSYTINLNLPESTNIEVFNTIFRALKENLLT